jgi:hypothetical protein
VRHRSEYVATAALVSAERVRLINRDFVFIVEHLHLRLKERRIEVLAWNRGIKKAQAPVTLSSSSQFAIDNPLSQRNTGQV